MPDWSAPSIPATFAPQAVCLRSWHSSFVQTSRKKAWRSHTMTTTHVDLDGNHLAPDTLTGLMEAPVYRNSLFHLPDPRNRPQKTGPAPPLSCPTLHAAACDVTIAPFESPGAEGLKKLSRPTHASGNTPAIPSLSGIINRTRCRHRSQSQERQQARLPVPFAAAYRSAGAACEFPSICGGFLPRSVGQERVAADRSGRQSWRVGCSGQNSSPLSLSLSLPAEKSP